MGSTFSPTRRSRPARRAQPSGARPWRRGLAVRIGVAASRRRLDRDIAAGISPAISDRHAARAAQLTAGPNRLKLAGTLALLVQVGSQPSSLFQIQPRRTAIDHNRARIDALSSRLRGPAPIYAAGAAKLVLMLCDGTGPLYTDRRGEALQRVLTDIEASLTR